MRRHVEVWRLARAKSNRGVGFFKSVFGRKPISLATVYIKPAQLSTYDHP